MAKPIDISEAKTHLPQLAEQAEKGGEMIIARKPGRLKGRIRIGRSFDHPLPTDLFEGKE